jgi:FKBP-type peptidyl-prolyl cis-trans isomerase FkpA
MRSTTIRSTYLFAALILALVAASCGGDDSPPASPSANVSFSQTDLRVGTGTEATAGRRVTVNYTGWLYSSTAPENKGQQFDSSVGAAPFAFTLGTGQVIRGWDQGVVGMRVGGQRRLVIPAALGYGATGQGPIPPNAALVFDIELLNVS